VCAVDVVQNWQLLTNGCLDAAAAPLSKRQQKLAERRVKAEEHNRKVQAGRDTMAVDTEESKDRTQVQAEIEMEVDI
jgi:hypothetical protein